MKKLEDDLTSEDAMNAPLHEVERMLRTQGREMLRAMMQAHFDRRSEQERTVDVRGADGIERIPTRRGSRTVMTEFGEVELDRNLYQAPDTEGLAPLDAAMALPEEKYSYEVRRIVAEEAARASFDEVVELVAKQSGAHVPKRQLEQLTIRASRDFDEFYRDRLCRPEDTDHLLVLSFDAKGIAIRRHGPLTPHNLRRSKDNSPESELSGFRRTPQSLGPISGERREINWCSRANAEPTQGRRQLATFG